MKKKRSGRPRPAQLKETSAAGIAPEVFGGRRFGERRRAIAKNEGWRGRRDGGVEGEKRVSRSKMGVGASAGKRQGKRSQGLGMRRMRVGLAALEGEFSHYEPVERAVRDH